MNLDLSSLFPFGDQVGLTGFMLDHRFVHDQTSQALATATGRTFTTFGLTSPAAEEEWLVRMQTEEETPSVALTDWLFLHSQIHVATMAAIGGPGVGIQPEDLAFADFSKPEQFYGWIFAHQLIHDYEAQALGLS